MLVLIDKCGCPGFKIIKGSTSYLVIGIVYFKNVAEAEKASRAINELKMKLGISPQFKFSKTNFKVKEIFFDVICHYDFEIRALIADKVGMNVPDLRSNTVSFYQYLIATLLQNNNDIFLDASVKINKNVDRNFQQILTKNLREQSEQPIIKKFTFRDEKSDSLIQLVDMITGAISKNYMDDSLHSHQLFNKLIENNKIKNIWKLRESS